MATQRPGTFRRIVYNDIQLVVLHFKKLVKLAEIRAGDIPMAIAGLGVQKVFVGENGV